MRLGGIICSIRDVYRIHWRRRRGTVHGDSLIGSLDTEINEVVLLNSCVRGDDATGRDGGDQRNRAESLVLD